MFASFYSLSHSMVNPAHKFGASPWKVVPTAANVNKSEALISRSWFFWQHHSDVFNPALNNFKFQWIYQQWSQLPRLYIESYEEAQISPFAVHSVYSGSP